MSKASRTRTSQGAARRPAPSVTPADAKGPEPVNRHTAILELGRAAFSGVPLALILGQICAMVEEIIKAEYCEIVEFDASTWARLAATGKVSACPDSHTSSIYDFVLAADSPVVSKIATERRFDAKHLLSHGVAAVASVPLRGRQRTIGVVSAGVGGGRVFAPEDISFMEEAATIAGDTIESLRAEHRYRAIIENSPDGIALLDGQFRFVYTGPSTEQILGYPAATLCGASVFDFIHERDLEGTQRVMAELRNTMRAEDRGELRFRRADGSEVWLEAFARNLLDDLAVRAIVVNFRDVSDRKRAERQLIHQAHYDALTDLPNRILLVERAAVALSQAARRGEIAALLYVDVDRFKTVNDTFGHETGDRLLIEVAHRMRQSLREEDTVSRVGGDEFVVLLADVTSGEDAIRIAEKVANAIKRPLSIDQNEYQLTVSIGISLFPSDGSGLDTLLATADRAMYRAKESGRDAIQLFSPSMQDAYAR